jgi:hypothetical protein
MRSRKTEIAAKKTLRWYKSRAFMANYRAKLNTDEAREAFYRLKDAAINVLLEADMAFVNSVDWSQVDPIFGIQFVDGGKLHTKLSCLSSEALRNVRRQLPEIVDAHSAGRILTRDGSDYTQKENQYE